MNTYEIIQTVTHYDRRGNVLREEKSVVFTSDNVIETVKYRYENARGGHWVKAPGRVLPTTSITLATARNNSEIEFSEIFRIVEGDAAYNAVLNDERAPVNEQDWIAAR